MNEKIFRSTFLTVAVTLLAGTAMIIWALAGFFEVQLQSEMKNEAGYIALYLETEGEESFSDLPNEDVRITWIAEDGSVIADSKTDSETLDNHKDREEVKEAFLTGEGESSRFSETLTEKTVYYAIKLDDGTVLRLSVTQYTIVELIMELAGPIALALFVALALSVFISMRVSKSIVKPINELDLENPANNDTYPELAPLLGKISKQSSTIKRQLAEAYQKQKEFSLITENMTEGVLVVDEQMNLLSSNKAARALLDAGDTNIIGNVLVLNRSKPFRTSIEGAVSGTRSESTMEYGERTYQIIASPVTGESKIIGAVVLIIDVTDNARRETLRREFTANVSHELKTPLTSISGFAELIAAGGVPEETTRDFAKSIYDEARRLISLVSDIIKISELDERDSEIGRESVPLYELCRSVVSRLAPETEKMKVSITLSGEKDVCVNGNAKILDEMVSNLCDNAIKYNKEGGSVDVSVETVNGAPRITVKDTAIGIPEQEQKRVFERFYRVDKSRSKAAGGTGLGLSIVKHGASYHNAELELESTPGIGTKIRITFPKEN